MVPAELKAAARARRSSRERIWIAMRQLKTFTVWDLVQATGLERPTLRGYLQGYAAAGYIAADGHAAPRPEAAQRPTGYRPQRWKLVRDIGVDGPRIDRAGKALHQGNAREQLWRTMKILREFNARQLAVSASTEEAAVSPGVAKRYCAGLAGARYLVVVGIGRHNAKRYRFLRNTGSQPPVVRWRQREVYDPNTDETIDLEVSHD